MVNAEGVEIVAPVAVVAVAESVAHLLLMLTTPGIPAKFTSL